jgi:alpha-methylacyl-CoA racemase
MMLADMGAEIIHVLRKGEPGLQDLLDAKYMVLDRGRRSVSVDLKKPEGVEAVLRLVENADGLQEQFRPGIMEKIGLGPDVCLKRNPKLVYGRMTGWGQEGPLASAAGHDINYIALSGALHAIGPAGEKPVLPINLVGDFGGGGMLLAFGMVCALFETQKSGKGQVVDAAMIDGSASMMGFLYGLHAAGVWSDKRGTNLLDGGAHFYDTYETKDGKWIAIGPVEPKFYELLLKYIDIDDPIFKDYFNPETWPECKEKTTKIFKTKTRQQWCEIMEGTDACFSPVLSYDEAINHPHNVARKTFVDVQGVMQPGPAPRFSRTKGEIKFPPPDNSDDKGSVFKEWGFDDNEIETLKKADAI